MIQLLLGPLYPRVHGGSRSFLYTMYKMQLATKTTPQAQRTPTGMVRRGAGTRQVKLRLPGTRKLDPVQTPVLGVVC